MKRTWRDVEELASDLAERYPELDPIAVELTELRAMIVTLPTFGDEPGAGDNAVLEAIQASWYDEYQR